MGTLEMVLIALGMGMDAFAVSLGAGSTGGVSDPRATFRLAFHFGLFQFLMPLIGWYGGFRLQEWIAGVDHWVAFALLAFVGGRMIRNGMQAGHVLPEVNPSRGMNLVTLSLATSIDALAVGLSLAFIGVAIWIPSLVIGIVTLALSLFGLLMGDRLGAFLGRRAEVLGGVLLVSIGLRIVGTHLGIS